MIKHCTVVVGLISILVGLSSAFGQAPARRAAPAQVGPLEAHVAEKLIPRQPPREDDWPMRGCDVGNTFYNRHAETLAPPFAGFGVSAFWKGDVLAAVVSQ